jgi:GTP cyclohydrolase II
MMTSQLAARSRSLTGLVSLTRQPDDDQERGAAKVSRRAGVSIPLPGGALGSFITFDGFGRNAEHFAVQFAARVPQEAPLVRMHSECITGDLFGSLRCDCGAQLEQAIELLKVEGGILIYLRQEGRGIGLAAKLEAYRLQEEGLDTYAANRALSLPADARDYACGADMLRALGVSRIRLISNNPDKGAQLARNGISVVEILPTATFLTPFNQDYLTAKARVTGHTLSV